MITMLLILMLFLLLIDCAFTILGIALCISFPFIAGIILTAAGLLSCNPLALILGILLLVLSWKKEKK